MSASENIPKHARLGNGLIRFSGSVLFIGSIVKFLHPAKAVAYMAFFGYTSETLYMIAALELVIALLFLRRSTRGPGLLLVSAYMGGAIAAHVAHHALTSRAPIIQFDFNHPYLGNIPPMIVLLSAWIGVWLRHPELFGRISVDQEKKTLRAVRAA